MGVGLEELGFIYALLGLAEYLEYSEHLHVVI